MAVVAIGEVPGRDAAEDARIGQELDVETRPVAGVIARFAGPTERGWRVISVWESEEAFRTFQRERMRPVATRLGLTAPTVEVAQVDSCYIAPQR